MIKKLKLLLVFCCMLLLPTNAFADTFEGSALLVKPKYYPEYDKYMAQFDKSVVTHIVHRWYSDDTYTTRTMQANFYSPNDQGQYFDGVFNWNCKNRYMETIFYDSNEQQVGLVRFYSGDIVTSKCTSGPIPLDNEDSQQYDDFLNKYGSGGSGGSSSCTACEVFSCPGWSQYMSGLADIKNAIPPAPNWQVVSQTFRDTIAPRIKADLDDLLGHAPDPPAAPAAPSAPSLPSDLDDRGISAPTGQEAPGLGDSTFDKKDIEDQAPKIQEREDPTGGFDILDPIGQLPSQEEFESNQPNEGTADLPANPKEDANPAPMPGDTTDSPPMPSDDTGTAPIPSESGDAPIPGYNGGNAPIPNEQWQPPIPGQ